MSIFTTLYLKLSKKKFYKEFKPLGMKRKRNFLLSVPSDPIEFLKILPCAAGLKELGNIVMLVPRNLQNICRCIKPNIFQMIFYEKPSELFSKEHKRLKERLANKYFHFLIELDKPANISLPYLASTEKRICFHDESAFPYYNIMIKDSTNSLSGFFNVEEADLHSLFHFRMRDSNRILQKYGKKKPILFINGENDTTWKGDKIRVGKDISTEDPEIYTILYFSNAYLGQRDGLYEFARIFNKEIVESTKRTENESEK